MKQGQINRILLGMSVGGFLLMSLSFSLMPFEKLGILPGILFWVGLLAGGGIMIILENRRRRFFSAYQMDRRKMQKPRCGLLTFGSNKWAVICDILLVVSVAGVVFTLVYTNGTGYGCYLFISATCLTFCLHCIINGRIYFHVNNQDKVRRVLEQKKVNSINKGEGDNEKS